MDINNVNSTKNTLWKQLRSLLIPALVLLISIAGVSCASSVPQELTASEKLWKNQALGNYDFTLTREAFAPYL